ncbi:MAG: TolC family protein [Terriglobales bacterium]
MSRVRRVAIMTLALAAVVVPAEAQEYTRGKSQFPNFIAPYTPTSTPAPSFANSPRMDQVLKDGKLMLSLDQAIALALENNLDLAIARYNLSIADTEILRTKSGSGTQGVATGIVQGTPGGGVGGFGTGAQGAGAGGTTAAAGGAGTGAGGIVTSTLGAGPAVPSFDPVLTSNLNIEHGTFPQTSAFITGTTNLQQNVGTANFGYSQGFATGTTFNVSFNNSRQTTSSLRSEINPILNTSYRITLTQNLLQGFGLNTNRRFIRIAKNNREISDVAFRLQVITTVSQIENIYWDLVNAYQDVQVKQRSLNLAEKLLADNRKQVEIGTLAPIEVVRAQSAVATASQDLLVSQTNLQLQQLLMKNAISRNLTDPQLAAADVIPTDTMKMPEVEPVVPIQDLIADALAHRAELAQSMIDLTNRDITKKAARNALLPSLDLVAWYGTSALAGEQNLLNTCGAPSALPPPNCLPTGAIQRTGYGNAISSLFGNDNPDYAVGFQINIPILNRAAQATQMRSELEYRQAQMRLQQLQNQIRIQVRNAHFALQQDRARVQAAISARDLAQQTLDAEQKKYALGASTTYNVMAAQRDLAQAESNVLAAMTAYEKDRVALDQATGMTLTHLGIELADAESGNVKTMPKVPNVVPEVLNPPATMPQTTPPQQQ